jgi:hypothetical protein
MKIRIQSGGQTGADLAGLWVAKKMGLLTGGLAPQGYKTLIGNKPALKEIFGLKAMGDYRTRTIENVRSSDVTLIFARNMNSPGTVLTKNSCMKLGKQSFSIPDNRHDGETLRQYWGNESVFLDDRFTIFRNALDYLLRKAEKQKQIGLDDYFIINVAGNATKTTIPDIFDFTFIGLWYMLILYGQGLRTLGLNEPNFSDNLLDVDPAELAAKLKDHYEE